VVSAHRSQSAEIRSEHLQGDSRGFREGDAARVFIAGTPVACSVARDALIDSARDGFHHLECGRLKRTEEGNPMRVRARGTFTANWGRTSTAARRQSARRTANGGHESNQWDESNLARARAHHIAGPNVFAKKRIPVRVRSRPFVSFYKTVNALRRAATDRYGNCRSDWHQQS
jgi:hypothetical protein